MNTEIISNDDDQTNVITLATAVRVLQAHERARQGRVHAYFMQRMKRQSKNTEIKSVDDNQLNESCLIIQTIWRQKYAEKLFYEKKLENAKMLGMVNNLSSSSLSINFLIFSDFTSKK